MVARCVFWLIAGALLLFLFVFARKRFNQVILVGALSTIAGVLIRLTRLGGADETELVSEGYFLIGIGVLYGIVWLAGKYLHLGDDEAPTKVRPKGAEGTPRR